MLKLIKTVGGNGGIPEKCPCGSGSFIRSGIAWSCDSCGLYFPVNLKKGFVTVKISELQKDLQNLTKLHGQLDNALKDLEDLVKG